MTQIFLFSGENLFTLTEERKRWTKNFTEKHGEENLMQMSGRTLSLRDLLNEVAVAPFIAERRLVIVEGVFKCKKDEAAKLKEVIHPQVILLFIVPLDASKWGKLPVSMKEIEKIAEHKHFPNLRKPQLHQWMDDRLRAEECTLTADARELLLNIAGDDQAMLSQELAKLSLYAGKGEITRQHVLDLAICAGEREIWHLMDLLGEGRAEEGVLYIEGLLERGDNPQGIWSRLLWMVAQLTLIWAAVRGGTTNPASIAKEAGVSFNTVRALLPCARRLDVCALRAIVDRVAQADRDIKTGVYRATTEATEEMTAIIDRCLLAFSEQSH